MPGQRFSAVYWESGKENITFTESRIRFHMIPVNTKDTVRLQVGFTENHSLIAESPEASEVIPNISMGVVERVYEHTNKLLISFVDLNRKRISDFLLILSGIFIGISTGFLTNWLTDEIDLLRLNK